MGEGEFQKQVKEAFKIELILSDDEVGTQLKAVDFPLNSEWMRKVDVVKILDVARKDFEKAIEESRDSYDHTYLLQCIEKWFGSE